MKDNLTKSEIQKKIFEIFSKNPSEKDIKNAKKLAMSKNIKIGDLRKKFCKKCNNLFSANSQIRINKGFKTIKCSNCGLISRYKIT